MKIFGSSSKWRAIEMLESLYYSSAGLLYISFSRDLIALSISLKDIVSIELFDNIENYN